MKAGFGWRRRRRQASRPSGPWCTGGGWKHSLVEVDVVDAGVQCAMCNVQCAMCIIALKRKLSGLFLFSSDTYIKWLKQWNGGSRQALAGFSWRRRRRRASRPSGRGAGAWYPRSTRFQWSPRSTLLVFSDIQSQLCSFPVISPTSDGVEAFCWNGDPPAAKWNLQFASTTDSVSFLLCLWWFGDLHNMKHLLRGRRQRFGDLVTWWFSIERDL